MSDLDDAPVELLIVSHQELTRHMMTIQLRHRFSVETLESGAQALMFLGCQPVEFVIVEYRMPEMDGLEVIRQARAIRPDTAYTLLVDEVDFGEALRARLDRATDYVVRRPWDAHALCVSLVSARSERAIRSRR